MAPRGSSRHTMTPRRHPRVARPARDVSSTVTRRCDRHGTTHLLSRKNGLDCLRIQKSMASGCHRARSGRTRLGVFENVLVGVLFFNSKFRESFQKSRKSILQTVIKYRYAIPVRYRYAVRVRVRLTYRNLTTRMRLNFANPIEIQNTLYQIIRIFQSKTVAYMP
jgi:hypothetical protein